MQNLQFLIDMLTKGRKIHVSVLDVVGILNTPSTEINFKNLIHSKEFCDIAKSTPKGFRACLHCKYLANAKAISSKKSFCGHCAYGIFEAAMPVIIGETVAAIVYVGNAIIDEKYTKERIEKVSDYASTDAEKLYEKISECEYIESADELMGIAEIVSDYIKTILRTKPRAETRLHWLVSTIKQHADQAFCFNPTLKELSVLYHKNEKYLGRLFKEEMGVSFHQYCLRLRLEKAEELLLSTSDKIIDVALECGFNNISYFNRAFKAQYGTSPSEYAIKLKAPIA